MERAGLNQTQLAEIVGVKQPSIGRLLTGETKTSRAIDDIARALGTTSAYLKGVEGNPADLLPELVESSGEIEIVPNPGATRVKSHDLATDVAAELGLVPVREVDLAIGLGAAYLDQAVSAAVQYFPREWLDLYTRAPSDKLIITRGSGDSMIPTFLDNDLILIDTTQTTPRLADQIWAVSYCGLGSVKRLRPTKDGGWLLMADNRTIPDIAAYDDEMHVLGRVVAYFRKM
jgi:phage repressor protein C with HTH and peptisase S24 domain